jgi:hypothetical protein
MIRFQCDGCENLKDEGEDWILGFAAERVGVVSSRLEVSIASSWNDARALEVLAVHFCSDPCKVAYMDALFGRQSTAGQILITKRKRKVA